MATLRSAVDLLSSRSMPNWTTRGGAEAALRKAGLEHEIVMCRGANHAFFNATGGNDN